MTSEEAHNSGKRKTSESFLCFVCGCKDFPENLVKAQQEGINKVVSSIKEIAELYVTDYISMNRILNKTYNNHSDSYEIH